MIKFLLPLLFSLSAFAGPDPLLKAYELRWLELYPGTNYISVFPPSLASNYSLTLPTDDGLVGECLKTDGVGVLDWQSCTAGAGFATIELDNLSAGLVAINTSLISDSDQVDNLGSSTLSWLSVFSRSLLLQGSTSGELTHTVPATVTSYSLSWPNAQGAANTFPQNDGAGILSWSNVDLATSEVTGILPTANGGSGVATASANTVFAGPTSGGASAPTFRSLVSADLPTQVKVFAYDTSGTAYGNGPTDVTFNTEVTDSNAAFGGTTFTVPTGQAGFYNVCLNFSWTGIMNTGQGLQIIGIWSGGNFNFGELVYDNANSRAFSYGKCVSFQMAAGDTLKLQIQTNTGGNQTLVTADRANYISIVKVTN